ncbi:MAG: MFS transporter [Actinomycetota bacterium]
MVQRLGKRPDTAVHFGWVSLLQDLGSKMVVPVLTPFLVLQLGASAFAVGLIDGLATVSAALVAPVAGRFARRRPARWVRVGYGLSSAMKLALAVATVWPTVLVIRVLDRAGKGIRDTPRDVLLAAARPDHGRSFGIQQAMDKTGGFLGPLLGLAVYQLSGESFDAVFVVAFVPCVVSVLLLWRLPAAGEPTSEALTSEAATPRSADPTPEAAPDAAARTTPNQRVALVAVALHALGFITPSLLLLRALDIDATVVEVVVGYALLRLVTAIVAYPAGRLVDRYSARLITVTGMAVSAAAIALAAVAADPGVVWLALAGVGAADALTRGPVKAWLLSLGPPESRGAVLGDRAAVSGLAAFIGSIAAGAAWSDDGQVVLLVAAGVIAAGCLAALGVRPAGRPVAPGVDPTG